MFESEYYLLKLNVYTKIKYVLCYDFHNNNSRT